MVSVRRFALCASLLTLLFVAYSNHFHNSFHFDDFHTIQDNLHVRSLANASTFFTDARTFSNLPTHQVYRPLLTLSLAFDYVRGGGQPLAFHVTSFTLYVMHLAAVFALFVTVMNAAVPDGSNWNTALFAAAVYGLHPVSAETVNYIVQRADLLATFGVTVGIVAYAVGPQWRRWHLYLGPVILALLCKPPALVFPIILFAYVYLFENRGVRGAARAIVPSAIVCCGVAIVLQSMTEASFNSGGTSPLLYRITQPFVASYYFLTFFAPTHLNADTDWRVLSGIGDPKTLLGFIFLGAVLAAIWVAQRRRDARPIAFGLVWFLAALFPTSWMPLAEVANDHRMFFPFVGLTLAVVWGLRLLLARMRQRPAHSMVTAAAMCLILVAEARATYARNEVWRSEETLWHDVTLKSPTNGRGLMNYALVLMGKADYAAALRYLEKARIYNPAYFLLEINLGILKGEVGRHEEAEKHFLRAMELEPRRYESYFFYARWLNGRGRTAEAATRLRSAVELNLYALDARRLLMRIYSTANEWGPLEWLVADTLRIAPKDPDTLRYSTARGQAATELERLEATASNVSTAENYLSLSLAYYRGARYEDCIRAAQHALRLRPGYAEAYNNIAAGHNAMRRWREGISAADAALRINPAFELARNNRAWAQQQLAAAGVR